MDLKVDNACTPVLLSDLKEEQQKDWIEKLDRIDRESHDQGEDFIVGYYTKGYKVKKY